MNTKMPLWVAAIIWSFALVFGFGLANNGLIITALWLAILAILIAIVVRVSVDVLKKTDSYQEGYEDGWSDAASSSVNRLRLITHDQGEEA